MTTPADGTEKLGFDMAASLLAFVVSGSAAAFMLAGLAGIVTYLLVHALCAGAAMLLAVASGQPPRRQALLHAMMATALGPVGSAGCFLCCVFELCLRPFSSPFTAWFDSIFPEEQEDSDALFFDRLSASADPLAASQRVVSFRDSLSSGSIEQKQALIALIASRFSPAFAPALRHALQDPVPAVRVQAAAAAAAIETRYAERTFLLAEAASARGAGAAAHRNLAAHLAEFAESGIAEEGRSAEAARRALQHLDRALELEPHDAAALVASARLLLQHGIAVQAYERITRALSTSGVTLEAASLYVESLMQLGRFGELRAAARRWAGQFAAQGRDGQRLEAALHPWLAREAVHAQARR